MGCSQHGFYIPSTKVPQSIIDTDFYIIAKISNFKIYETHES